MRIEYFTPEQEEHVNRNIWIGVWAEMYDAGLTTSTILLENGKARGLIYED